MERMKKNQFTTKGTKPWKYCWTHGTCTNTGTYCKVKAGGHNNNVTFQDRMGGFEMHLKKAKQIWVIVNKHKNNTFKLCLNENKIKHDLKVMFTRLLTNNVLSV